MIEVQWFYCPCRRCEGFGPPHGGLFSEAVAVDYEGSVHRRPGCIAIFSVEDAEKLIASALHAASKKEEYAGFMNNRIREDLLLQVRSAKVPERVIAAPGELILMFVDPVAPARVREFVEFAHFSLSGSFLENTIHVVSVPPGEEFSSSYLLDDMAGHVDDPRYQKQWPFLSRIHDIRPNWVSASVTD